MQNTITHEHAAAVLDTARLSGGAPRSLRVRVVPDRLDETAPVILEFVMVDPATGAETSIGHYSFFPPARIGAERDIHLTLPASVQGDVGRLVVRLAPGATPSAGNTSRLRVIDAEVLR